MEAELNRLVELWSQSLEAGLEPLRQVELDHLLARPELAEALVEWQAERSPQESGEAPALDDAGMARATRRVRNRMLWDKAKPYALGAGIGLMVAVGWWLGSSNDNLVPVSQSRGYLPMVDGPAASAPKPQAMPVEASAEEAPATAPLGPPPGFGSRPRSLTQNSVQAVALEWSLPQAGRAEVLVLNSNGQVVRRLYQGMAQSGLQRSTWNGSLEDGSPAAAGHYRLVARHLGRDIAVKDAQISAP